MRLPAGLFFLILLSLILLSASHWNVLNAQLAVSEASANDGWTLQDGSTHDWIELRNDGPASVNLQGHRINDSFDFEEAWELPALELQAG